MKQLADNVDETRTIEAIFEDSYVAAVEHNDVFTFALEETAIRMGSPHLFKDALQKLTFRSPKRKMHIIFYVLGFMLDSFEAQRPHWPAHSGRYC